MSSARASWSQLTWGRSSGGCDQLALARDISDELRVGVRRRDRDDGAVQLGAVGNSATARCVAPATNLSSSTDDTDPGTRATWVDGGSRWSVPPSTTFARCIAARSLVRRLCRDHQPARWASGGLRVRAASSRQVSYLLVADAQDVVVAMFESITGIDCIRACRGGPGNAFSISDRSAGPTRGFSMSPRSCGLGAGRPAAGGVLLSAHLQ